MYFAASLSLDFLTKPLGMSPIEQQFEVVHCPYYFSPKDIGNLPAILLRPNRYFLEVCPYSILDEEINGLFNTNPDFSLSISTAIAYHHGIAKTFAKVLEKRFCLTRHQRMNLHTCLQETIANAIIHGNLGIESMAKMGGDFESYQTLIAKRILEPTLNKLRIGMHAWFNKSNLTIAITDQGKGFPEDFLLEHSLPMQSLCGRGLFIIQSMASHIWIGENRKTLFMTFDQQA